MLLRPAMTDILKPGESYYEFVVQVAREARKIADEERKLIETEKDVPSKLEKPVTAAVQKFFTGELKMDADYTSPKEEAAPEEVSEDAK